MDANNQNIRHTEIFDIVIVGGGPTGLYGSFFAGLRKLSCKIIDALPQLGGQTRLIYPKKNLYNVAGHTKIVAEDLIFNLIRQGTQFGPSISLNEQIVRLEVEQLKNGRNLFHLYSNRNHEYCARTILLATGAGEFKQVRLDIPGILELENQRVFYFVRDWEKFRNKSVLVIGGGDTALDCTLALQDVAYHVSLAHRSNRFKAYEESIRQMYESSKIHLHMFCELESLTQEHPGKQLEVCLLNKESGERLHLHVDYIICGLGFEKSMGPIKNWNLDLDEDGLKVGTDMATSISGIWSCGDAVSYCGKIKLLSTGFAEANIAVNMAKNYLDPNCRLSPGYSIDFSSDTFKV